MLKLWTHWRVLEWELSWWVLRLMTVSSHICHFLSLSQHVRRYLERAWSPASSVATMERLKGAIIICFVYSCYGIYKFWQLNTPHLLHLPHLRLVSLRFIWRRSQEKVREIKNRSTGLDMLIDCIRCRSWIQHLVESYMPVTCELSRHTVTVP